MYHVHPVKDVFDAKGGRVVQQARTARRAPLSRERVLRAAVDLADDAGIDAVSMRRLAQELGVVPMALYKHVANKDELLDGMRHRWASQVVDSRTQATPVVLDYMNSLIGMFRAGGFSVDLTHHVMHALGTRMWGFTQEVFPTPAPPVDPEAREVSLDAKAKVAVGDYSRGGKNPDRQ